MSPARNQSTGENQRNEDEASQRRAVSQHAYAEVRKVVNRLDQMRQKPNNGRLTARKTRLLICAWVREGLWHLLKDARSRAAVEIAERFVDGQADDEELKAAARAAAAATSEEAGRAFSAVSINPAKGACCAAWATTWSVAAAPSAVARYGFAAEPRADEFHQDPAFAQRLADLLARLFADIVGPETLPAVDHAWFNWNGGTLPKLAQAIYENRCFADLPILADALEEAGCANVELLGHLRGPGPHGRGCWALDIVLGKE